MPGDDVTPLPQPRPAWTAIDDRRRKVGVAVKVRRNAIPLSQAKYLGSLGGIDEIFVGPTLVHDESLQL
jgi:hypothetical protein